MNWKKITAIAAAAALVVLCATISVMGVKIRRLTDERDKYRTDTETLLDTVKTYRTRDSLSAAQVGELRLSLAEFKKYREEDAALIKTLKARNRELASVNATQTETIIALQTRPRDTVVVRDSVKIDALALHCGDEWYDFDGILTKDEFTGELKSRDALLITETIKYKRFLGFLWKCGVKDRKMDVVSRNPHSTIIGAEFVRIEKN